MKRIRLTLPEDVADAARKLPPEVLHRTILLAALRTEIYDGIKTRAASVVADV